MSIELTEIPRLVLARDPSLVEDLISDNRLRLDLNSKIIIATPLLQQRPPEEVTEITRLINSANDLIPEVRKPAMIALEEECNLLSFQALTPWKAAPILATWLEKQENPPTKLLQILPIMEMFLRQTDLFTEYFNQPKQVLIPAVCQVGIEMTSNLYQNLRDEDLKKYCKSYFIYYAAILSANLGIKTGGVELFLTSPQTADPELFSCLHSLISCKNLEELREAQDTVIFGGRSTSTIKAIGGEYYFFT
jgi:hypothetical protein